VPGDDDELLTTREAADAIGVSERQLRRYQRAGELPVVKIGRATRVQRRDLRRFVREHRRNNAHREP
jgi:excisionase family DNA binding protein